MASNKNQHYVPQCYLRQFSQENSNASICLFNLSSLTLIETAPIKNQCSKNYFYGKDLVIEKALQPIEGKYSALIQKIKNSHHLPDNNDCDFLLEFWLLQYLRTEAASKRTLEITEGMVELAEAEDYRIELDEAVQHAMQVFVDVRHIVKDMKVVFFKNKTDFDFYTSDDPAVLTNRWHLFDERAKGHSFGLNSAGNLLILPLTPKIAMLAFDSDVYSLENKNKWVVVKDKNDIDAINSFQFINCRSNIYSHSKRSIDNIQYLNTLTKKTKPESKYKFTYAVLESDNGYEKTYKPINKKEAEKHSEALIHCQPIHVSPPNWPKQIKWKAKGFLITNGSGLGFLRKAYANKCGITDFYKVSARKLT